MDKSRQQFEEWRSKNKSLTMNLFDVWQASRESLINNLPESINCPTAPELIWLQVDPEPEEENKPVYPVNLRSDDVTWCADRVHPTDTLYIRAYLIQT
ncbi:MULTISPECIES: hypothetical protein [Providencia]|uniref:hypothetical protein n=1 Tax=Providencia TaxID=586 RepID=UPI00234B7F9E|nr:MULTISPECIES: hypothetical protein [Providencia]ELR5220139.1 hypothetical protein [Providencia rettgeri]MDX7322643.1 hypothetical protein [Providencia rettgeri]HEM8306736.1 hypothetical protein [Providencia rettgeri]